jgi:hypothetical protein
LNAGTPERWNAGTLERWNAGTLERWNGPPFIVGLALLTSALHQEQTAHELLGELATAKVR